MLSRIFRAQTTLFDVTFISFNFGHKDPTSMERQELGADFHAPYMRTALTIQSYIIQKFLISRSVTFFKILIQRFETLLRPIH